MSKRLGAVMLAVAVVCVAGLVARADEPAASAKPISYWIYRLKADSSATRLEAARALGVMGNAAARAVPELAQAVLDPDSSVRHAILKTLADLGPLAGDAAPIILPVLTHEDPVTRIWTARALGSMGRGEVSAAGLIEALHDDDPEVRAASATAMGRLGRDGKLAIPRLLALSADSSEVVRKAAAKALPLVGPTRGQVAYLAADLKSPAAKKRLATVTALGKMGPQAASAVPSILRLLDDPDASVRSGAANVLIDVAPDSARVRRRLIELLTRAKEERPFRLQLALKIAEVGIDASAAVPAIVEQTQTGDDLSRRTATMLLGRIRPTSPKVVSTLVDLLRAPSDEMRAAAVEALGQLGTAASAAGPALLEMMRADPNKDVRVLASAAYYRVQPE